MTPAFLVRDAIREGATRKRLAHLRWHRPFSGVRSEDPESGALHDRALQYLPRLRQGEHFSHATALALMDCPIRVPPAAPVDVSSPARLGRVECRGVHGRRHNAEPPVYVLELPGCDALIPVSSPLDAVRQAALTLTFPEVIVALDSLIRDGSRRYDPHLRVDPGELAAFAARVSGRGAVRFREAAALARVGAESRMETLTRLAGVCVGMPELQVQRLILDRDGRRIGRFDLADEETRSLYEYDGEQHHFSRRQRRRDPRRHQAARDAGWRTMALFAEDLHAGLASAGQQMLEFSGRSARPVRRSLAALLDEASGPETEPAHQLRSSWERYGGDLTRAAWREPG